MSFRNLFALALIFSLGACSHSDESPIAPDLPAAEAGFSAQELGPALQLNTASGPQLDLLPRRANNVILRTRIGYFRAALVGTPDFDVRNVDRSSLRLEGVRAIRARLADTTGPVSGGTAELTPVIRINCGGPELAATPAWLDDSDFLASDYANTGFAGGTTDPIDMSHPSIPAGTPMALFQTERYDGVELPDMNWEVPVDNGSYAVRLYFADTYPPAHSVGARLFDISVEGELAFADYDIFARVGGFAGVVEQVNREVDDGSVSVSLARLDQNPTVCAIEVLELSAGGDGVRVEDGVEDLNLVFHKWQIMRAIGPVSHGTTVELTLSGSLRDGTPFTATDTLTLLTRGGGGSDD